MPKKKRSIESRVLSGGLKSVTAFLATIVLIAAILQKNEEIEAKMQQALAQNPIEEAQVLEPLEPIEPATKVVLAVQQSAEKIVAQHYDHAHETTGISREDMRVVVQAAINSGMPWEVLVAKYLQESSCGRNVGTHRSQDVLRGKNRRSQREAFMRICERVGREARDQLVGGSGEMGPFQFLPSTWETEGRDGSGDEIANPWNLADAAYSAGCYLKKHGYSQSPEEAERCYNGGAHHKNKSSVRKYAKAALQNVAKLWHADRS